jgi:predicted transcriptional regulator
MATKTVNVSEETKKFLDAIADVMDYTQDRAVQIALYKLCPVNNWQNMSLDELKMAIAKHQIRRMRFHEDLALADKYGMDLSEVGNYPPDLDGIRDYDVYCRRMDELIEDGTFTVVKKKEESS